MIRNFFVLFVTALLAPTAFAQEGTGLGIVVGSPNGITARHWIGEGHSIEGAAGWSVSKSRFQVNGNFLMSQPGAIVVGEEAFDLFYGLGASLRTKSGSQDGEVVFGPRIPVGAAIHFVDPNLELFIQAALNVGLIPSSDLYLDANLGVRFYLF